jgi:hypothetical protein
VWQYRFSKHNPLVTVPRSPQRRKILGKRRRLSPVFPESIDNQGGKKTIRIIILAEIPAAQAHFFLALVEGWVAELKGERSCMGRRAFALLPVFVC